MFMMKKAAISMKHMKKGVNVYWFQSSLYPGTLYGPPLFIAMYIKSAQLTNCAITII